MLELEQAREQVLAGLSPLPAQQVPLEDALGRVPAKPLYSSLDLPPFDSSAVDGYAVRADDLKPAGSAQPVRLILQGQSPAGTCWSGQVEHGACVRVFTGSVLPPGADAIVMQEDTRIDPAQPEAILVCDRVKPWEHVRLRGEDVKRGSTLLEAGQVIGPSALALLGAAGVMAVEACRQPRVAVLATGSELVEAGQSLIPGQIYESNRIALAALLRRTGAVPCLFPLVPDTLPSTRKALEQALAETDAVVSSGGVSVGEMDLVKKAFEEIGGKLEFWRVAIKPGKPFAFGRWRDKILFGLPGNPVSAFVTFLLLVRPALLRWQGVSDLSLPTHPGVLQETLVNRGDRRHFVRVHVGHNGEVRSAGGQASHLLSSLAEANGLVELPVHTSLAAGTTVPVMRWEL